MPLKHQTHFYFYPEWNNGGCIPSYFLRALSDKLDELNKEWDETIDRYFNQQKKHECKFTPGNANCPKCGKTQGESMEEFAAELLMSPLLKN